VRAAACLFLLVSLALIPALATADTAAPTVAITSPEPGLTVTISSVAVEASYQASGNRSIKQVELLVDGIVVQAKLLDPPQASGAASFTWAAARYPDGSYQIGVRVTDTEGDAAVAGIPILLQRQRPEPRAPIRIGSPLTGETVSGETSVKVTLDQPLLTKYVIFLVDDVFKAMSNIPPFIYLWDTSRYLNGLHRLQAKVYLSDGGESLSPAVEVRVGNPGGATVMKEPETPAIAPAPEPVGPPSRAGEAELPPPMHTESPSPPGSTIQLAEAEVATPGTAPYVSPTGDLVIPPPPAAAVTVEAPIAAAPAGAKAAEPQALPAPASPISAPAARPAAPTEAAPAPARAPEPVPIVIAMLPPVAAAPATPAERIPAASSAPQPVVTEAAPLQPQPQPAAPQIALLPAAAAAPVKLAERIPAPSAAPEFVETKAAAVQAGPQPAATQMALLPPRPAENAPAPQVVAQPAPQETEYVVQPGDCLWVIAAAHHIAPARLAQLNGISDPSGVVYPGQRLRIPSTTIYYDGKPLAGGVPVVLSDGRAIVPLRTIVEGAGGTVTWVSAEREAGATLGVHQIKVKIGSAVATVDAKAVTMSAPAALVSSHTVVPLRFLGDSLNLVLRYQAGAIHIASR